MQLTLCPLFSGSSGNSVYISCGGVRILVDAGVSATRVEANLREIGVDIRNIDAILVTHEHVDHIRGLGVLCRRYGLPVYANEGTWDGILQRKAAFPNAVYAHSSPERIFISAVWISAPSIFRMMPTTPSAFL